MGGGWFGEKLEVLRSDKGDVVDVGSYLPCGFRAYILERPSRHAPPPIEDDADLRIPIRDGYQILQRNIVLLQLTRLPTAFLNSPLRRMSEIPLANNESPPQAIINPLIPLLLLLSLLSRHIPNSAHEIQHAPKAQILAPEAVVAVALGDAGGPDAGDAVDGERVEDVLGGGLGRVEGPAPLEGGDGARVRQVPELEADLLEAEVEAPPDLDEPVPVPHRRDVRRVGRELRRLGRAREPLAPVAGRRRRRRVVQLQGRAAYEELLGAAP